MTLENALEAYCRRQDARPSLTAVVQAALREFFERRGLVAKPKKLRITAAKRGSGKTGGGPLNRGPSLDRVAVK